MVKKKTKMRQKKNNDKEEEKEAEPAFDADNDIRIKKLDPPTDKLNLEEWREVIKSRFSELVFPAEMGLAVISQILINDITNPFALVLIDVPSSGKTITVNFFDRIERLTYASDKFTPAAFVSNAFNQKKSQLKKNDLLPRIRFKMFLLRDLATLFSKRDDDLMEALGIMTRILDGEGLTTDTGVHGNRSYVGDYLFMLLAASTPITPKVWKVMGNLGSRLFFLNMHTSIKTEEELAEQITNESHKRKETDCRNTTRELLLNLWKENPEGIDWDKQNDPQELRLIISRCAKLLAKLRGVINVWHDNSGSNQEYQHTVPVIEKPDRINQLFYNLARGHAVVVGRRNIDESDLKFVIEITMDSCPRNRATLFRELLKNSGSLNTTQVMEIMNCSRPTALNEMKALQILGICRLDETEDFLGQRTDSTITLKDDLSWFLSNDFERLKHRYHSA